MNLFIDTNILIDCLKKRKPFYEDACKILMLGVLKEATLWVSNTQLTDAFYLLTNGGQATRTEAVKKQLLWLLDTVNVAAPNTESVRAALNSTWADFEDACVYQAARAIKADAIITRNQKDFIASSIRVCSASELFAWLAEERGITYRWIDW